VQPQTDIAMLLLASGLSRRFGADDKLLATLAGQPVLSYAAALNIPRLSPYRLAVIDADNEARGKILINQGWNIISNPKPDAGQGGSIALAFRHLRTLPQIKACVIVLADMPHIPQDYLEDLVECAAVKTSAVMSRDKGRLCPPALFKRESFDVLANLRGDKGAKAVFMGLENISTLQLTDIMGLDIDTPEDLSRSEKLMSMA